MQKNATNTPATNQKAKKGSPSTKGFTRFTNGIIPIVQINGISVKITFTGFIVILLSAGDRNALQILLFANLGIDFADFPYPLLCITP